MFLIFCKNHVFQSNRNWDVNSLTLLLFMDKDELLGNLNHFLSHKCLRISGLVITSYNKSVTHWRQSGFAGTHSTFQTTTEVA